MGLPVLVGAKSRHSSLAASEGPVPLRLRNWVLTEKLMRLERVQSGMPKCPPCQTGPSCSGLWSR